MSMHAVGSLLLDEGITTIVKLRNVAPKVLDKCEFATRMLSFIAVSIENQVVKND